MKKVLIFATAAMLVLILATSYLPLGGTIHNRVANRVMRKTAKQIERRHQVQICGKGFEMFGGPIKSLDLSFTVFRQLPKEEARKIVIDCLETFVDNMRNDPDGEAAFYNWPLDHHNASIALFTKQPNGANVYYPYPSIIDANKGKVKFIYFDAEGLPPYNRRKEIEVETIEEALATIEQETHSEPPRQVAANRQSDDLSTQQSSISGILRKTIR